MQHVQRAAPIISIYQVIPIRDDIVDGTALMAKGNATIHASGALLRDLLMVHRYHEFAKVPYAVACWYVLSVLAVDLQETRDLAHYQPPETIFEIDDACWAICISCRARR